jgi:SAM-dependent methyltransferase
VPALPLGAGSGAIAVVVQRLVARERPVERVLDLGCGAADRLAAVLAHFPAACGIAIDFSFPMLAQATDRLAGFPSRVAVQPGDLRTPDFWRVVPGPVDVVLAGSVCAALAATRRRTLYSEIFLGLQPGGSLFVVTDNPDPAPIALECESLRVLGFLEATLIWEDGSGAIYGGSRPCN